MSCLYLCHVSIHCRLSNAETSESKSNDTQSSISLPWVTSPPMTSRHLILHSCLPNTHIASNISQCPDEDVCPVIAAINVFITWREYVCITGVKKKTTWYSTAYIQSPYLLILEVPLKSEIRDQRYERPIPLNITVYTELIDKCMKYASRLVWL